MECGRVCYFRLKFNLDQIINQLSTEMGGVNNKEYQPGTKEEQDRNREINKQLRREFKEENQIVKLHFNNKTWKTEIALVSLY